MNTTVNTNRTENMNAAAMVAGNNNKINDFGQKIGGARKDLYQAANEWAALLATVTADALSAAGGVSKLLHLPNLEKMTEAGAISAEQARAALIIWRGIERKPQGSYSANRWAERTHTRLETVAKVLTSHQSPERTADELAHAATIERDADRLNTAADLIRATLKGAEFKVLTAANWPAEAFTFGKYEVRYYSNLSSAAPFMRILSGRYYEGTASPDPANIAAQLREMTAADAAKAAERRDMGPQLAIYHTSDFTRYFIAVKDKCEIVLKVCNTEAEAREAVKNERPELLKKYDALRSFPALRRSWNRPRVGKEWHAADVTPDQFAAAIPFKGVEFGNWLNQDERAALLNSAFDGFHDLAYLLGIEPAAVALGGCLNFSFATRGHANSAAHFSSCYNTINLNKRNGAGCMAHEWLHAADHFAAVLAGRGRGISWGAQFATEYQAEPVHPADKAARALIAAIKKQDFYTRSQNYQRINKKQQGGQDYYTQPAELAARGFEGVVLYLLNCAGMCSDFLVNLESWKNFEMNDAGHRRDCYPYPSDAEAAALLPYYMDFFRALFGACEVSNKAAEGIAAATIAAAAEKAEAEQRAAEKAEQEARESAERKAARRAEFERRAAERRAENERKAAELKAHAEKARAAVVEMLTARHFDNIATGHDAAAVYAVAHLEGEIYTICADIDKATNEGRAYVDALPLACLRYKRIHNAKRVICRYMEIRAKHHTAAEMIREELANDGAAVRSIANCYANYAKPENIEHAAKIYADTMRSREELNKRAAAAEGTTTKPEAKKATEGANSAPAEGLRLEDTADGVRVVGDDWKDTYFNKRQIKENGAHWNKEAKQWEATDPADVARLRAWFALRDGDSTNNEPEAEPTAPAATTLQDPAEITATESAPALPEWLKVGSKVRTRGAYMIDARTGRPEWVEGEEMTVKAISAEFVELEKRDENGALTGLQSISTAKAAAELTPVLYEASEITATEEPADDYAVNHHGATLTNWDQQHPAPVAWCKPGQVFKLRQQFNGRDIYAIITKLGTDCFFYVGNFGNCSEHLSAYNTQQWDNLQPVEIMHEDTPKFAKMFEKFHSIRKAWEADGVNIWEERERKENTVLYEASEIEEPAEAEPVAASYDTADPAPAATFETSATAEEQQQADALPFMEKAAILDKVQARIFAPWGDVCRRWLVPFRGALAVWNAWAERYNLRDFGRLADWALTAKVGERAECRGLMVQIWERDGQTTAEPTTEPDRLKANRETRERLRAAIVAELEAADVYIYPFNNEMKVICKVMNAEQLYKVQDIARRYSSAQFRHDEGDRVCEFVLPLFFSHFFPTDPTTPTPEPSGEGEAKADTAADTTLENTGEITAPTADQLAVIISQAKKAEKWSANGKYNYGPIESLRAAAYKHTTTAEEYTKFFDEHLAEVTNAETYCVWLLRAYDITVDETQVYCDLRRAFPAIGFKEACKLIKDHMSPEQQGNGIAAALVPDFVLIESDDQNTREHFRKRHEKYNRTRAEGWNPDKLRKCYDLESLAVHLLLEWELFYTWEADRAEKALEYLREVYPEATADDLHRVFMAVSDGISSIYD